MSVLIGDGRKVVASAGTAEALVSSSTPATKVVITAETDNTGIIVVGSSSVVAAIATRKGTPLSVGDSYSIEVKGQEAIDLKSIYLDTTVSGDGVTYSYINESRMN